MSTSDRISPEKPPPTASSSRDLLASIEVGGEQVKVDLGRGIDLSIPMTFTEEDPNLYGIAPASKVTFQVEGMVGDTRLGGSCNVDTITLTPHCHGTHTECVGHVSHERRFVNQVVPLGLIPSSIISITPEPLIGAGETSRPALAPRDLGITKRLLKQQLASVPDSWVEALLIRTLPNDTGKKRNQYVENGTSLFSIEAVSYLIERGVGHILVDLPSLDRLHDKGEMAAHRTWWHIEKGSHQSPEGAHQLRTITELIYIPNDVSDGPGLVSLQIPPFESDAAPSRPIFYPVLEAIGR